MSDILVTLLEGFLQLLQDVGELGATLIIGALLLGFAKLFMIITEALQNSWGRRKYRKQVRVFSARYERGEHPGPAPVLRQVHDGVEHAEVDPNALIMMTKRERERVS